MVKFWWWKRKSGLDAAGRRAVRSALGEIDYQVKQMIWDVTRVANADAKALMRRAPGGEG